MKYQAQVCSFAQKASDLKVKIFGRECPEESAIIRLILVSKSLGLEAYSFRQNFIPSVLLDQLKFWSSSTELLGKPGK